ncbi:MAG: ParA family protein [Gemmatimonadota bacterium]|nr:ParA family protein [Gemmatimonadota bacterium]
MARKVSLINMKGGVGKSTVTVNLAWHFAAYRHWLKKILVIDLDPQFNASQYLLGVRQYENLINSRRPTMWDVFEQGTRTPAGEIPRLDPNDVVTNVQKIRGGGCIDLIPSRLELALSLKNPGQKERNLTRILSEIEDTYDLILIDCAPTESILTTAAYLCSDYLLVPVKPEYLSSIGLPLLVNSMQGFLEEHPECSIDLAGVLFNATDDYTPEEKLSKQGVRRLARENGWYVFDAEVPYSRSFPKGAREGSPIFRTSYSRYSKIRLFNKVAEEFAMRIGL